MDVSTAAGGGTAGEVIQLPQTATFGANICIGGGASGGKTEERVTQEANAWIFANRHCIAVTGIHTQYVVGAARSDSTCCMGRCVVTVNYDAWFDAEGKMVRRPLPAAPAAPSSAPAPADAASTST